MNKIDRRFLKNMGFYVTSSSLSSPPNPASVGDRVVISKTPNASTIFKDHANEVAYYDGTEWSFYKAEINDLVIDLNWGISVFNGTQWVYKRSLDDYWVETNYVVCDAGYGDTFPVNPTPGEKFLFLKSGDANDKTIYQVLADCSWGYVQQYNTGYVLYKKPDDGGYGCNFLYNENRFYAQYENIPLSGTLYLDALTKNLYVYEDNGTPKLYKVLDSNEDYGHTVEPVTMIVGIGDTLPAEASEAGERYLKTADKKLYTATAAGSNKWGNGVALTGGVKRYASLSNPGAIYKWDGTNLLYVSHLCHGEIFFNDDDCCEYVYTTTDNTYRKITPQISTTKTVAETHTLTSAEITAKKFTLSNTVATGEESNALCFVQGVAQAAGVAFSLSGNELSWDGKTLDGNLTAGDVFIVSYQEAITLTN